jgi:hypothetical protein
MMNKYDMAVAREALDALQTALNLEGCTRLGATAGAYRGLDVDYHYAKIREAIRVLQVNGIHVA